MMSRGSTSDEDRLDRVLADYMEEADRIREPDRLRALRERYLADYLDIALELERYFKGEDAIGDGFFESESLPDFQRYTQVTHIGHGAMGVVYRAFDRELERWVAIKMGLSLDVVSEREAGRFRMEAQSMARLKHPNIVRVFDVNDYAGRPYLSMELVSGGTLDGHLNRFRGDARGTARLMVDIARAVHHAHQRGILHRDLKPSNILLDTDEHGPDWPHVSDFGLAKPMDSTESRDERRARLGPGTTEYGKIVGTASYMSPEQASGRDATILSDVYGLGGIMYALLTGRAPFRGKSVVETLEQVKAPGKPLPPHALSPGVDRTLEAICLKCLEKEPEHRYPSAEGLARELERWLNHRPTEARPLSGLGRLRLWGRRRPMGVGLAAAVAVLLGLIVWNIYDRLQEGWRFQGEVAEFQARDIAGGLEDLRDAVASMTADPAIPDRMAGRNWPELQEWLVARAAEIEILGDSPFASCYILDDAGFIKARWPRPEELETDFSQRDYYRQAMEQGGTAASKVFYSVSDGYYKFAASAPVLQDDARLGVLACSVTTTPDIGGTDMEDLGFAIAVLAFRDPSRVANEAEREPPHPGEDSDIVVFAHPLYEKGATPGFLPARYVDAHTDIFEDGRDGCVDDYVDPVAAGDGGRFWDACFAHVDGSAFIAVVQRR